MRASLLSGAEQSVYRTHHTKTFFVFKVKHSTEFISAVKWTYLQHPLRFCLVLMEFTKQMNKKDTQESKMYGLQWNHLHKESLNHWMNHMTHLFFFFKQFKRFESSTVKVVTVFFSCFFFHCLLKCITQCIWLQNITECSIFFFFKNSKSAILDQNVSPKEVYLF